MRQSGVRASTCSPADGLVSLFVHCSLFTSQNCLATYLVNFSNSTRGFAMSIPEKRTVSLVVGISSQTLSESSQRARVAGLPRGELTSSAGQPGHLKHASPGPFLHQQHESDHYLLF
jgi:hypothetical protein